MARATFVQKARKDVPGTDIKAGESYYWWKFKRSNSKCYSRTQPRPSQLTQSAFFGQVYGIEEEIGDASPESGLADLRDDWASRLREIGEECQSSFDNMPEGLQQGDTGQLLEERVQAMESAADELEGLELDDPDEDELRGEIEERDEEKETQAEYEKRVEEELEAATLQYWTDKLEELQNVSIETP